METSSEKKKVVIGEKDAPQRKTTQGSAVSKAQNVSYSVSLAYVFPFKASYNEFLNFSFLL